MSWKHWVGAILAGVVVCLSLTENIMLSNGEDNLYVLEASAFLHGRLDIDRMSHDASIVNGRLYVAFPPAPAMFLVPIVAVLGRAATNVHVVALLLSILSLVILKGILTRLDLEVKAQYWLILAFFLGTGNWLTVKWAGGVWFLAHVFATLFLLLAIFEALGKARGWLVGLCLGLAFLSRQLALFNFFFLLVVVWKATEKLSNSRRFANLLGLAVGLGSCVGIYLLLNYVRFGNPLDTGYHFMPQKDLLGLRIQEYGAFNPAYLPFNLIYLLLQGFHVSFHAPDILTNMVADDFGTCILTASPFVILAFYADRSKAMVKSVWLSVAIIQIIELFYFGNGWVQHNTQRYTLDYWPALMVLIALGFKDQQQSGQTKLWQWLIIYAAVQNTFIVGFLPELNDFLVSWVNYFWQ